MKDVKMPRHVGIIMDGNGRWAKLRGQKRYRGHRRGMEVARKIVEECARLELEELTLYAFSTENWLRPRKEVNFLMKLLRHYLKKEKKTFAENGVRFRAVGDRSQLPDQVMAEIDKMEAFTSDFKGLTLRLAVSYGGRYEILHAVQNLARQASEGEVDPLSITLDDIKENLYDSEMSDADLIIRTGGEFRISNFLLWQCAYAEFWITEVLWPDFTAADLHRALADYGQRDRRFGKVSEG